MEEDNQSQKIMIENQKVESSERPFDKLAPEVIGHILSFLKADIPSLMSASGVCGLWRELVDWKLLKQLHLDFEHMPINKVSMKLNNWAPALESLLSKVKITSIWVTLPYKLPKQHKKRGKYAPSLFWPLHLLECGVAIHSLITNHRASFSSVTVVRIQGCPCNAEFEFVCHLLELCPSLSILKLNLTVDRFSSSSLQWALRGKSIRSLGITLFHVMPNSAESVAQLCQVLAPGTLKTLTLITNVYQFPKHGKDRDGTFTFYGTMRKFGSTLSYDDHVFCFDQFLTSLQAKADCVSALEHLELAARQLALSEQFLVSDTQLSNLAHLVHKVLPMLRTIKFNIPGCDMMMWTKLGEFTFKLLSKPLFNHPVDVTLTSRNCNISQLFSWLTPMAHGDIIYLTKEGFNHHPIPSQDDEPVMKFVYKRLPRTTVMDLSCSCHVCGSEYQLIKNDVAMYLRALSQHHQEWIGDMYIYACQLDHLRADLVDEFPTLELSLFMEDRAVRIRMEGKEVYCCACAHEANPVCAGCGMMSEQDV